MRCKRTRKVCPPTFVEGWLFFQFHENEKCRAFRTVRCQDLPFQSRKLWKDYEPATAGKSFSLQYTSFCSVPILEEVKEN